MNSEELRWCVLHFSVEIINSMLLYYINFGNAIKKKSGNVIKDISIIEEFQYVVYIICYKDQGTNARFDEVTDFEHNKYI